MIWLYTPSTCADLTTFQKLSNLVCPQPKRCIAVENDVSNMSFGVIQKAFYLFFVRVRFYLYHNSAKANSSLENGVSAIASIRRSFCSRSTRKKLTTSPSKSLYVSTGEGSRLSKTAPEPSKGYTLSNSRRA